MEGTRFRRVRVPLIESPVTRRRAAWRPLIVMLAVTGVLAAGCAGGEYEPNGGGGSGDDGEYEQNGRGGCVEDDPSWFDLSTSCGDDPNGGGGNDPNQGGGEYEPTGGGELHVLIQRTNTMLGLSLECFTFFDGGLIELRHSGNREVSDTGVFYGDETGGEIEWDSGRYSTYEGDGVHFRVDGAQGAVIDSCLGS